MFSLTPVSSGGWTESVLHLFGDLGKGGYFPLGLIGDRNGGFYGVAGHGALFGDCCGVVFHLIPTSKGGFREKVLHTFTGGYDGKSPNELVLDASGNIFGTTNGGDTCVLFGGDCGTVFEIVNPMAGDNEE